MSTSLQTLSNVIDILQINIVWYLFWNQTRNKNICKLNKGNSRKKIYFRNLSVQRSFLQYKSQCLKKVNVKYMISRLWHEMFHIIVPGISPRPISALQLCCRAWYRSLGMIPGPIWKMSCNNLLILLMVNNHLLQMCSYL
jgi:hypothetical protein